MKSILVLIATLVLSSSQLSAAQRDCGRYAALALQRSNLELGGFAHSVTPEEIVDINRSFGGETLLNGQISSAYAAAAREVGFFDKAGAMVRNIAGNHLFDNGNKRTANEIYKLLRDRNHVMNGISPEEAKKVIQRVARGELKDVGEIGKALRGY